MLASPVHTVLHIMHSVFYGTCPAYLTNIVESVSVCQTRSTLRSTSSTDFTLPRLSTKFRERAFSHAAWNALPEGLRTAVDPAELRKTVEGALFHFSFQSAMTVRLCFRCFKGLLQCTIHFVQWCRQDLTRGRH